MSHFKHTSKTSYEKTEFEWELTHYFFYRVTELNVYLDSPTFNFGSSFWRLRLLLSRCSDTQHLFIQNMTANKDVEMEYQIGLKKLDGSAEQFCSGKLVEKYPTFVSEHLTIHVAETSKKEMLKRKQELAPPNGLTFICILRRGTAQKCVLYQAPPTKFIKVDELSKNFKNLSENKDSCDVILKVKEKEFPVHKAILLARSPVFAAMFKHDTLEKRTGTIDIPDCDPDSFHKFLEYLYCGKLQDISFRSAFHLYKTSDKYGVRELMPFCVEYMKHSLTEDNVCDVIKLAELYSETQLMAAAQAFFNENGRKVVMTTGWESLLETNHVLANKFIIEMVSKMKKID